MTSPGPQKTSQRIQPFQAIGRPIRFGKITVQLCAMPRKLLREGREIKTYGDKRTIIPSNLRGERERFYPFKLGFYVKKWDQFFRTRDLYRLMEFQLLFERKVRFLDVWGNLQAVKTNSYWETDHLQPLKDMIQEAEERDLRKPLAVFM